MTDDDDWEESAVFMGECTCDHEDEAHSYGGCYVDDCDCEAGWEE